MVFSQPGPCKAGSCGAGNTHGKRHVDLHEVGQTIAVRCAEAERDIPKMECPVLDLRRCQDPGGEQNLAVLLGRL